MKKVVFAALVVAMGMGFGTGSAFAAGNSIANGKSLSVGLSDNPLVGGKLGIANDLAVLGGIGLTTTSGGGSSTTNLLLEGGIRKYLKVDDFAPFADAGVGINSNSGNGSSNTDWFLFARVGAECFLTKQFSIEGSAGLNLGSTQQTTTSTNPITGASVQSTSTVTSFGTQTFGLSANYYF